MGDLKELNGELNVTDARIAIVAARFNGYIVESLVNGAVDTLKRLGVPADNIELVRVPGAYELPLAADRLAATGRYDGLVALGVVIRGATPHFDLVAGECSKGLAAVSRERGIALGFGVLTTETIEQAIERAGTKAGNKGADAAASTVEMISLLRKIG